MCVSGTSAHSNTQAKTSSNAQDGKKSTTSKVDMYSHGVEDVVVYGVVHGSIAWFLQVDFGMGLPFGGLKVVAWVVMV